MRARLALALGIIVAVAYTTTIACVGTDPSPTSAPTVDGSSPLADTGTATDAPVTPSEAGPSSPCDLTKPFGTPRLLPKVNELHVDDAHARFSTDERTIYFSSYRNGAFQIFTASRALVTDDFGTPALLPVVNTGAAETQPMLSSDGLSLYFEADRSGSDDIYLAKRMSLVDPFPVGTAVAVNISGISDQTPFLSPDGAELWFASSRAPGTAYKIFHVPPASATASESAELNTAGIDTLAPVLSANGQTIYFASKRDGGSGGYDIWSATRASAVAGTAFGTPANLSSLNPDLNSSVDDLPSWVSVDDCRLYLTSNRSGDHHDIYIAERPN
jgi:Tol biopolymer transport system component